MMKTDGSLRWAAATTAVLGAFLGVADAVDYDAEICGQKARYESPDGLYDYASNAWNAVGSGFQCVSVTDSPPAMDATWMWDEDGNNVHSYPHIRFESEFLPTRMQSIRSMRATANWVMSLSSDVDPDDPPRRFDNEVWTRNRAALEEAGVRANVAWDFFADQDKLKTYNPVDAQTEIMIWLTQLGNAEPLRGDEPLTTMELSGLNFTLYYAKNQRSADVFTWMPPPGTDVNEFDGDLAPLIEYIRTSRLIPEDSWLGLVEFGTETWHSTNNVTFSAFGHSLRVDNGEDPNSGDGGDGGGDGGDGGDGDDEGAATMARVGGMAASVAAVALALSLLG